VRNFQQKIEYKTKAGYRNKKEKRMKVIYVIIALIVIGAVAFGAYFWVTESRPEKRASVAESAQVVNTEALEKWRDEAESRFADFKSRIRTLEVLVGRLQKETDSLKNSLGTKPTKSSEKPSDVLPAQQESNTPGALREEVKNVTREKERQDRMFEENQRRYIQFPQRRLERITQRFGWDDQKKRAVSAIVTEQQQEVKKLLEAARDEGATGQEARETLVEKIHQVNASTIDKLRAILTPEEAQEVERAFGPSRIIREPGGEPPPSGENTPMPPEPEPGK
jgi:chromosome segregation ATPase